MRIGTGVGVVVDASVAIKWFVDEAGSGRARRLWQTTPDLKAPDLLLPEAASLAPAALEIALALEHPAYDCFYIALAELDASAVVTADRKLLARVDGSAWASRVTAL